jgi:alanine or glycine:cation symporter, AGCS family
MSWVEIILNKIYHWVWGAPLLSLLIGTGLYFTFFLKGIQFRYLFYAIKLTLSPPKEDENAQGEMTHFQSLMTALAATVGVGTIAGVGTALSIGGVGSLFWMVIVGLLGMVIKYSEALLAVVYRVKEPDGTVSGGPMYYIEKGMRCKWLGATFAFLGVLSSFGIGNMVQAHSVQEAVSQCFHVSPWIIGGLLSLLVGTVVLGGVRSIANVSSILVPFMALIYMLAIIFILSKNIPLIYPALLLIVDSAFQGQAAFGGFIGSTLAIAFQEGVSKGMFSNGAGLGSAAIAAAAAKTDSPGRQAIISMMGTFITMILTFLTGLVIAVSQVFGESTLSGTLLTIEAFSRFLPGGYYVLTVILILFAFSTILGWTYYGEKCFSYLFGKKYVRLYRLIFTLMVIPGTVFSLQVVWSITGITNGLMAVPNLIAILALRKVIELKTKEFIQEVNLKPALLLTSIT